MNKSKAERDHHAWIASQPCVVCTELGQPQVTRTTVHHIREGQGISQRASHWLAVPLCEDCHQGTQGVHGDRSRMRLARLSELDMLATVIKQLTGNS